MSNTWFTSDHHFGHARIIELTNRPFKNVVEMNEEMIERWNSVVGPKDVVYHLGDFAFYREKSQVEQVLSRLNGMKRLIKGNHDHDTVTKARGWEWVRDIHKWSYLKRELIVDAEFPDEPRPEDFQKIVMFHYPMLSFDGMFHGAVHLYGHVHSRPGHTTEAVHPNPAARVLDVGVDNHNFTPWSLDEVMSYINALPPWTPKATKIDL